MDVDGEEHEQVPKDGDMDADGFVTSNVDQSGEVRGKKGDD